MKVQIDIKLALEIRDALDCLNLHKLAHRLQSEIFQAQMTENKPLSEDNAEDRKILDLARVSIEETDRTEIL